jgi:hypothetical protein
MRGPFPSRVGNEKRNRNFGYKKKMPFRLTTNGHLNCKSASLLLPNHGRAEEAQHLIDWIRDRIGAAAGVEQTDRTRISRYVFNH